MLYYISDLDCTRHTIKSWSFCDLRIRLQPIFSLVIQSHGKGRCKLLAKLAGATAAAVVALSHCRIELLSRTEYVLGRYWT